MDDIKTKIFDLIKNQGQPKIPIVGSFDEPNTESSNPENEVVTPTEPERPSDQEILETIDSAFYNSEDFDACRYELNKLENLTDIAKIQVELKQLNRQHVVVSNHVLQMILEKQTACQDEFQRIVEIQEEVENLLKEIKSGRKHLNIATRHFTTASLGILANYRKRTIVQQLLRSLNTIRTLHKTESRMPNLLSIGDFSGAITLILECLTVAAMYKHFSCVAGLSGKLQDTLEMTEEHLDNALAEICYGFDEAIYKKLQSAYSLLGKTQIAMDQLHMHFTSAVHNTASKVVNYFINPAHSSKDITLFEFCKTRIDREDFSNNIEFSSLCKKITEENFIPCLLLLCKSLWCIILSYNSVVTWHQNNPINRGGESREICYNDEQTMKQKLTSGLNRLWHDIQTRVSSLVLAGNLANYKFDDFLQILAILHRLSQIGDELCGSGSEEVASSIRTQSSNYFKRYHATKMDELKVFLENEAWTPCPVRSDFSVLHLQEFRGLRCSLEQCAGVEYSKHDTSIDSSSVDANFFVRYPDPAKSTPFDINFQTDPNNEQILASIPDEASGYFTEESDDEMDMQSSGTSKGNRVTSAKDNDNGPLLTNTTLTVLRLCGKYLQMSKYLKPIASQVVSALTQLYDFYLYTVQSFFTSDMPNILDLKVSSLKLQAVLNRIRDNLIINSADSDELEQKLYEAQISPVVDLTSPNTLYGLFERVVGVESLLFLSREFTYLRSYLEQLLQSQGSTLHNLQQFYNQTISVSFEVRKPVYACVAWRAVDDKYVLNMMSKVDWEVEDVMSQHSKYVDYLISETQQFAKRLDNLRRNLAIPEEAYNAVWENLIFLLSNIFVEGFSCSKKCSHAGRALMMLDYIQFVSMLQKICNLKPIPHREFVENYIKGYYTAEDQLESWIKDHREYTSKQLLALVSCVCMNNKKSRQRLSAFIEELENSGIR